MKMKFELGPNARWAGPGEILEFRSVQTSTESFLGRRHLFKKENFAYETGIL
jgi:hypothetical protein